MRQCSFLLLVISLQAKYHKKTEIKNIFSKHSTYSIKNNMAQNLLHFDTTLALFALHALILKPVRQQKPKCMLKQLARESSTGRQHNILSPKQPNKVIIYSYICKLTNALLTRAHYGLLFCNYAIVNTTSAFQTL